MNRIINLLIILIISFVACKKEVNVQTSNYADVSTYLFEHVPPRISIKDNIYLRFKKDIPADVQNNIKKYLKVSPAIKAIYTFQSNNQLLITPTQNLPFATKYAIKFDPKMLFSINEGNLIQIAFETKAPKFNLDLASVVHDYNDQKENSFIKGYIESNDHFEFANVKEFIEVKQEGNKQIKLEWLTDSDGTNFPFIINSIQKFKDPTQVIISVDGTKWDEFFKKSETIEIETEGKFAVSKVKNIGPNQKYISVVFSESLNTKQNLSGLIKTNDKKLSFKTEVTKNELRLYPESTMSKDIELTISSKIKNAKGYSLGENHTQSLSLTLDNPEIRLLGTGVVTPINEEVVFPFEAKNLNSIDVEIFKIYENNVASVFTIQFIGWARWITPSRKNCISRLNPIKSNCK